MSDFIRVHRNSENEYQVQIRVEGFLVNALIDTGMTNPDCLIGVGLDSQSYRAARPHLRQFQRIEMEGIGSDSPDFVQVGLGRVGIEGLDNSEVETYTNFVKKMRVGLGGLRHAQDERHVEHRLLEIIPTRYKSCV